MEIESRQGISNPAVVVAGGSSGIGLATAMRFAREGWRVCIASNDRGALESAHAALPGNCHEKFVFDICHARSCEALAQFAHSQFGPLSAIVNAAGISESVPLVGSDMELWDRQLQVLLYGSLFFARELSHFLKDGGRIIQITSIHHERVAAGSSSYGMAKAAITQMIRSLALELAPRNILANAVAPGFVNTPMSIKCDGTNELESKWFRENYVRGDRLPLRRAASPAEIGGVVWFLAGPDATYITGSVITVDGGLTITF